MNSKIQKWDIGVTLDEKLHELVVERGMSRDAALKLIDEAVGEWQDVNRERVGGGAGWAMNCRTWQIRMCDRDAAAHDEMWFEAYVDAVDCLVRQSKR